MNIDDPWRPPSVDLSAPGTGLPSGGPPPPLNPFVGSSPQIRAVERAARLAATASTSILILGESGTGKDVLARWIHAHGPRRAHPLVKVNCAGLSPELVDAELFGHSQGAFTGAIQARAGLIEAAEKGVVFLDEIGDLDPGIQGKLLQVLEEKRFRRIGEPLERFADVQFIAATNRDLRPSAESWCIRMDLYYRISALVLQLPALRERREDIPVLIGEITHSMSRNGRASPPAFTEAAMKTLQRADWPGNIRELANVLERTCHAMSGGVIDRDDLQVEVAGTDGASATPATYESLNLAHRERDLIIRALAEEGDNVSRAARRLGIPKSTLYQHLREMQLSPGKRRRTVL